MYRMYVLDVLSGLNVFILHFLRGNWRVFYKPFISFSRGVEVSIDM